MQDTQISKQQIAHLVHEVMVSRLPTLRGQTIAGNKSLEEYGADSVDRVEIILTILNRLGLSKPLSSFSSLTDVNEMVDYLCAMHQA